MLKEVKEGVAEKVKVMGGLNEKGNWDTIQSRIETIDDYCEEKEEIMEIKGVSKEELLGI